MNATKMVRNMLDNANEALAACKRSHDPYLLRDGFTKQVADFEALLAEVERLEGGERMLKSIEWKGYDTDAGERTCPNCGAWAFQSDNEQSIHAYACALATAIGAPREPGIGKADPDIKP